MNLKEMFELCTDIDVFVSGSFGPREMIAAFVRVNIDDELYEQVARAPQALHECPCCRAWPVNAVHLRLGSDASLSRGRCRMSCPQEEAENTSSELVYDEFVEMVGRIFLGREWEPAQASVPKHKRSFDDLEVCPPARPSA